MTVCVQVVENLTTPRSSTNTHLALNLMRTVVFSTDNGDRPDVDNIGIVITDGQSGSQAETEHEALAAKDAGIRMFGIGLTNEINADELMKIASEPLSVHYFNRTSIDLVQTVTSPLLWSVCTIPCAGSLNAATGVPMSTCNHTSCEYTLVGFTTCYFSVHRSFNYVYEPQSFFVRLWLVYRASHS